MPTTRILVADDCQASRSLLLALLATDSEIEVVAEADSGPSALELTRKLRPDLVLMDSRTSHRNGFEATKAIMTESPTPIVIVTESTSAGDVQSSMRALHAGALTILPRPADLKPGNCQEQQQLLATLKAMSQVKVVRHHRASSDHRRLTATKETNQPQVRMVAIAASTGGPAALEQVLSELPAGFPVPIFVVQHISQGFTTGLANWLASCSSLRVKIAQDGEFPQPATVYFGPEDRHLGVSRGGLIRLSSDPPIDGFRPSASHLFDSAGRAYGKAAVAVILTGMGSDGVAGLWSVRRGGGHIIAQDESTSVVFGMPGTAIAAGLADYVLPLPAIASKLQSLVPSNEWPKGSSTLAPCAVVGEPANVVACFRRENSSPPSLSRIVEKFGG